MLNSMMNYPYPILRNQAIDYKTGIFKVDIKKTNRSKGFDLSIDYDVTNRRIKEMLDQRILAYALQIQCVSTWYRKLEISENAGQNVFIPTSMVHERVDLCPCIIALKDISDVYKRQRLSRDWKQFMDFMGLCQEKQVEVITVRPPEDAQQIYDRITLFDRNYFEGRE